jgi:hypothetical protein
LKAEKERCPIEPKKAQIELEKKEKTSKDIKMNLKKKTDFFHYADKTSKISRSYLKTKK